MVSVLPCVSPFLVILRIAVQFDTVFVGNRRHKWKRGVRVWPASILACRPGFDCEWSKKSWSAPGGILSLPSQPVLVGSGLAWAKIMPAVSREVDALKPDAAVEALAMQAQAREGRPPRPPPQGVPGSLHLRTLRGC